ncbi:MAG TPA: DUF2179 domain-containing protein [Anaerolineaceae bacterium]|nr:DUF2179 domain-containing protein [Anaerolineaceae bacterium]
MEWTIDPTLFQWVILPVLIFLARVTDVTLGTLRIIFVARGNRILAPVLGFFEVLIWITAISQIMQNLGNAVHFIAYAAGFATGNYIGMTIEQRLAVGTLNVRTILAGPVESLIEALRSAGFGVTKVEGEGASGAVHLVYTVIRRKDLTRVAEIIHSVHPKAFISVDELQTAQAGVFPPVAHGQWNLFRLKGKR